MSIGLLLSSALLGMAQQGVVLNQSSTGWCSPNIAFSSDVTIICKGVDPRALKRLNRELSRKKLQLSVALQEANDWAQKYHALDKRLTEVGDDSELSREAEEYLHKGEFEKAGAVLDKILPQEEKQVDRTAASRHNRAMLFELQFQPLQALSQYEVAYRYRPSDFLYALDYGDLLWKQKQYKAACPVLEAALLTARRLAKNDPATYQADLATTLNNLVVLYSEMERLTDSLAAHEEALQIRRELARNNPATFQPDLASTLNNLGVLDWQTNRLKESEAAFDEALGILRELSKKDPAAYQPYLALTLDNLGIIYRWTQRFKESQAAYEESLAIRRELAKNKPAAQGGVKIEDDVTPPKPKGGKKGS